MKLGEDFDKEENIDINDDNEIQNKELNIKEEDHKNFILVDAKIKKSGN